MPAVSGRHRFETRPAIMGHEDFPRHAWETARAFFTGAAISLGRRARHRPCARRAPLAGEVTEPIRAALYAIPKITLYPVILLQFGLGILGQDRLRR
jgi:NitT/TauT family transport system permease protein